MTTPGHPDWADEERLDEAFARWFPQAGAGERGQPDEPPTGPPVAGNAAPATAAENAARPRPEPAAWSRSDDDVLPRRPGRRRRRR